MRAINASSRDEEVASGTVAQDRAQCRIRCVLEALPLVIRPVGLFGHAMNRLGRPRQRDPVLLGDRHDLSRPIEFMKRSASSRNRSRLWTRPRVVHHNRGPD